jgi:hypothetical protein
MKSLVLLASCAALLLTWSCGGKVFLDPIGESAGGGTGGAGGSGSTSSASTGSFTCDFGCGGPIGLCGCAGPCSDGKMRAIGCGGNATTGVTCDCVVDGETVGTCDSPTLACQLPGSCCEAIFDE